MKLGLEMVGKLNWTDKMQAWSSLGMAIFTLGIFIVGIFGLDVGREIGENIREQQNRSVSVAETIKIKDTINVCVLKKGTEERFEEWEESKCLSLGDEEILYNKNINQSCSTQNGEYYLYASLIKEEGNCIKSYERLR